jgi:hypothetical protein
MKMAKTNIAPPTWCARCGRCVRGHQGTLPGGCWASGADDSPLSRQIVHTEHIDFYPGSGHERGSRIKPYIQLVWSLNEDTRQSVYRSPVARGFFLWQPDLATSIPFFFVKNG